MKYKLWSLIMFGACLCFALFLSCTSVNEVCTISVANNSEIERNNESVEIWLNQISNFDRSKSQSFSVLDNLGNSVLTQLVDLDLDSLIDYVLFQTSLKPQETKQFQLVIRDINKSSKQQEICTYCQFISNQIDYFAWENDRVAFRTYGPECQRLFENGDASGLLSSGIDCWLKRVNYPIINKWAKQSSEGKSYHIDHGEGLDNYHVGATRGCGGTAILYEGTYVLSANFQKWRIIANGPIRSIFELEYAPYNAGENRIVEKKIISIDLGANFYRSEIVFEGELLPGQAAIGIAHHNKKGPISFHLNDAWASYWETIDDSNLGTAIIIDSKSVSSSELTINEDAENIWVHVTLCKNSFTYWAGFAWKKSAQFSTPDAWNKFLEIESFRLNNPADIKIK